MCTTMMARVRSVILASICATSMFQVSGSLSTSTGFAPARTICAMHETIVNAGMITSSPGPIPSASTAASSAAVPLHTAMPCLRPTRAAKRSSNCLTNGPSEEIQPVSMHSIRYFFSLPSSSGSLTGTKLLMTAVPCVARRTDPRCSRPEPRRPGSLRRRCARSRSPARTGPARGARSDAWDEPL